MILRELRGPGVALELHRRVTVVRGLDPAARGEIVDGLGRLLNGEPAALQAIAEVDGRRVNLPTGGATEKGDDLAALVVLRASDLPGARATRRVSRSPEATAAGAEENASDVPGELDRPRPGASAGVAAAETALADAQAAVERVEGELRAAEQAAQGAGAGSATDDALAALAAAERRFQQAQDEAGAARRALVNARADGDGERDEPEPPPPEGEKSRRLGELTELLSELESRRAELVAALVKVGEPRDTGPVVDALRRLQEAEGNDRGGTDRALALADRWAELLRRQAQLPAPAEPPEWLLAPALASRDEAREALTRAETGRSGAGFDPAGIDELERAHREVLDAEQRVMRKGSRQARRRLEEAQEAEARALAAIGASSYGDYLQRIVPLLEDDRPLDVRVAQARARLSDAEAVLEELYSGTASPEWLAVREEMNRIRADVTAVLGVLPPDDEIEAALRSHGGGDAAEKRATLRDELAHAGVALDDDTDPVAAARRWLEDAPTVSERRAELETALATVASRLAAAEAELADHRADAFFGGPEEAPGSTTASEALETLELAVAASEAAADDAAKALAAARARVDEQTAAARRAEEAAAGIAAARQAWEDASRRLAAAEEGLAAARRAAAEAAQATDQAREAATPSHPDSPGQPATPTSGDGVALGPARTGDGEEVDLGAVPPLEAEIYVLARLAALRSVGRAAPLPLVVDADVLTLPHAAARRLLALLARSSAAVQVVVLADSDMVRAWAQSLGPEVAAIEEGRSGSAA